MSAERLQETDVGLSIRDERFLPQGGVVLKTVFNLL